MIIANGKIYHSTEQDKILDKAEAHINKTLSEKTLSSETVISAIDKLGREIERGAFDERIRSLPVDDPMRYKNMAVEMLSREFLEYKLAIELGIIGNITPENVPKNAVRSRNCGVSSTYMGTKLMARSRYWMRLSRHM